MLRYHTQARILGATRGHVNEIVRSTRLFLHDFTRSLQMLGPQAITPLA
jgi:hypothetical protein